MRTGMREYGGAHFISFFSTGAVWSSHFAAKLNSGDGAKCLPSFFSSILNPLRVVIATTRWCVI